MNILLNLLQYDALGQARDYAETQLRIFAEELEVVQAKLKREDRLWQRTNDDLLSRQLSIEEKEKQLRHLKHLETNQKEDLLEVEAECRKLKEERDFLNGKVAGLRHYLDILVQEYNTSADYSPEDVHKAKDVDMTSGGEGDIESNGESEDM